MMTTQTRPRGPARLFLLLSVALLGACDRPGGTPLSLPAPVGSQLPHLSLTARGQPLVSWVQPAEDGHRLAFAVLEDGAWTQPVTVAQGPDWFVNWADVPSVMPLHDALWAAHWLVQRPGGMYAYDIAMRISVDGGNTWGEPFRPHDDDTPTEHGFVSLWPAQATDGTPEVGAVWLDGRRMLIDPAAPAAGESSMTLRAATFDATGALQTSVEVDGRVCECCRTAGVATPEGVAVAFRDRSADEQRDIATAVLRDGTWQTDGLVARDGWRVTGCPVNGPALAARGNAVAVAWFTDADGARRVRSAWRESAETEWSTPVDVAREALGRVDVAWLGDQTLAVSWMAESADGGATLLVARVDSTGGVGAPVVVATTVATRPAGFPRLLRNGDTLLLAWTRWQDAQPRVVVSHLAISDLPGVR